ncbi:unnamed protein product [Caenorhabditis nigoni]
MLLRFVVLFIVALFALASSSDAPPQPPNGTEMEPPLLGNGTEPAGPPPPMDGMNGTVVQENGNKTGGVMDWIKSKLGK